MSFRFQLPAAFDTVSLSQWPNYQSWRRQLAVIASLVFATALCLALLGLRVWRYGSTQSWLVWNLFLAWLPLLGALAAYNLQHELKGWPGRWLPVGAPASAPANVAGCRRPARPAAAARPETDSTPASFASSRSATRAAPATPGTAAWRTAATPARRVAVDKFDSREPPREVENA